MQATDSDKTATLQVFVTSTDTLIGSLTKKAKGYKGTFILSSNPGSITVKSSLGGSATAVFVNAHHSIGPRAIVLFGLG